MCSFDVYVFLSVCAQRTGQSEKCKMGVNVNSSKTVKATDFKFEVHVSRDSPEKMQKSKCTKKFFRKGACPGTRNPLNFWASNTNSSKVVKATDFTCMFQETVCT